ncbi:proline-rich protein 7 isoform X1 [Sarcophilus harrisii]|uniref:proline-rich protein 7 isoform X1 n=1 Tax=Sarcophilus harrisii TaxID=9305 RepID=UPI001301D513|nr:proline-rich protein 7 isoform X1 [Sarcophilus harrisii]
MIPPCFTALLAARLPPLPGLASAAGKSQESGSIGALPADTLLHPVALQTFPRSIPAPRKADVSRCGLCAPPGVPRARGRSAGVQRPGAGAVPGVRSPASSSRRVRGSGRARGARTRTLRSGLVSLSVCVCACVCACMCECALCVLVHAPARRRLETGAWSLLSLGCPRPGNPGPLSSPALTPGPLARSGGRKRGDAGAHPARLWLSRCPRRGACGSDGNESGQALGEQPLPPAPARPRRTWAAPGLGKRYTDSEARGSARSGRPLRGSPAPASGPHLRPAMFAGE